MTDPARPPRFAPGEMKRLRKSAGLSQEKVAELMQYSVWQIRRWEKGTPIISLENAEHFCRIIKERAMREDTLRNDIDTLSFPQQPPLEKAS
jgi:DNA-binding transcriptional regulator YiaG